MNETATQDTNLIPFVDEVTLETAEEVHARSSSWYIEWRGRIADWITDKTDEHIAHTVLVLPDLFVMITRLASDRRVPFLLKAELVGLASYIVMPLDLISDLIGPLGLVDDVGLVALALAALQKLGRIDPALLKEHYPGNTDPSEIIQDLQTQISENGDKWMKADIWKKIKARFPSLQQVHDSSSAESP